VGCRTSIGIRPTQDAVSALLVERQPDQVQVKRIQDRWIVLIENAWHLGYAPLAPGGHHPAR